jgi:polar amino acid transport system substrate-binding protein
MIEEARSELAPSGLLRAGINLSNFLLVSGRSPSGSPEGVAPDLAAAVAERLGVKLSLVSFPKPAMLAEAAEADVWDIGLIGADPAREASISFTAAYAEIESTFLVPAGSPFMSQSDIDQPSVRIAVMAGSAYGLWLDRNIRHATLVRAASIDESYRLFVEEGLDALAGLRPRLIDDTAKLPGSRILKGGFAKVQQAIGTPRKNTAGAAFLRSFVEDAKRSGLIVDLIARHAIRGLTVAEAARADDDESST